MNISCESCGSLHWRENKLRRYYKLHACIYDLSRWSFLFGRTSLLNHAPELPSSPRILEVGCGTGQNLKMMAKRYPDAEITGLDLSPEMLSRASRKLGNQKVQLKRRLYGSQDLNSPPFDLILFSYTLTMCAEHREHILQQVSNDLKSGGYIAVVDFHSTSHSWFDAWMQRNHVNMEKSLLNSLDNHFVSIHSKVITAYFGLWHYFTFWGKV